MHLYYCNSYNTVYSYCITIIYVTWHFWESLRGFKIKILGANLESYFRDVVTNCMCSLVPMLWQNFIPNCQQPPPPPSLPPTHVLCKYQSVGIIGVSNYDESWNCMNFILWEQVNCPQIHWLHLLPHVIYRICYCWTALYFTLLIWSTYNFLYIS